MYETQLEANLCVRAERPALPQSGRVLRLSGHIGREQRRGNGKRGGREHAGHLGDRYQPHYL